MWDFRRSAPKTGARERGRMGDHLPIYEITCNNVAFHHSKCSQSMVWHPFENLFPCPLLPFPQPHWGVFLSLEMEGFFKSSTGLNVSPWSNGCCMQRHHSRTIPGRIRHIKRFFPRCPAREDIRRGVDENTGQIRWLSLGRGFLFVYSHNKWQLYFNCFCFLAFLFSFLFF